MKMKNIQIAQPLAIIFDFDGVIVNSERVKFERLKQMLVKRRLTLKESDFPQMVGKKTGAFLKERFGKQLSANEIREIEQVRRKDQLLHLKEYMRPIRGAVYFVRDMKKKNIRICLATGTSRSIVQKTLKQLKLNTAFDEIVTGEEFASSKPNPEVDNLARKKLNVARKDVLVIEDSPAGVSAAKRAGLRCFAITTTQTRTQLAEADLIVTSFNELRQHI